jgi:ketosteroid isomerase-like protein
MKKIAAVVLSVATFILAGDLRAQTVSRALRTLVQTERDFAATSAAKGIRDAFLSYLAQDAIVFRPKPMPGRPVYEKMEARAPTLLTWQPAYAEAARAGDLGYTTGPYEIKERDSANAPSGFGHYVSVWKKQPSGLWKVVLDAGIRHPRPFSGPGEVVTREADRRTRRIKVDPLTGSRMLNETEREFVEKANKEGLIPAYLFFAADDIRLYREGSYPLTGKEGLPQLIGTPAGGVFSQPMDAEVSSQGDLGYAYGIAEWKTADTADTPGASLSFLRIWRRGADGRWKIALDLAVPIPPSMPLK